MNSLYYSSEKKYEKERLDMSTKKHGGARSGAGRPPLKERCNTLLKEVGWNWLESAEKYIRVGSYVEERRYWIAPFVSPDDNAVLARNAKSFRSLQELLKFLQAMKQTDEMIERDGAIII
jgi:hypothetical protein